MRETVLDQRDRVSKRVGANVELREREQIRERERERERERDRMR